MISSRPEAKQMRRPLAVAWIGMGPFRWVAVGVLLAAVTVFSFWPVTQAGFINYDDQEYVTENRHVLAGLTWDGAAWALRATHASNWHPLTWLSHMADTSLFGPGATGPHVVNLLLHVANSWLLFLVLARLTEAPGRSAMVAALFAIHPLHVESVAWVAERKDVLSTLLLMLTLWAYARYAQVLLRIESPEVTEKPLLARGLARGSALPSSARPWAFYGLALLFFGLGLMSKPMLVTLPCVLLLLDVWPLRRVDLTARAVALRKLVPLFLEKVPFFVFSAVSCVVTMRVQRLAMQPLEGLALPDRIANALVSYARYLGKSVWPTNLALPYPHPGGWPLYITLLSGCVILGITVAVWMTRRKMPLLLVGWLWFLGTLVPVIGLVQVGIQSLADRYTYVPLIGIFIAIVWGVAELSLRLPFGVPAASGLGAACLAICAMLTRTQASYWQNSETLFLHSAAAVPDNFVALGNVGGSIFARATNDVGTGTAPLPMREERLEEALRYFQRALQINPRFVDAINSIGAIYSVQGKYDAGDWFRRALELQPRHPEALFNMGNALARKGDFATAVGYFEAALRVKPENYEARNNHANALRKLGRTDEACRQYQLALRVRKDDPLIYKNLGGALADQGRFDEAIQYLQQALLYERPSDPGTHYALGLALAVRGRWDEAIVQYRETLRLNPAHAEAEYNLGYALRMLKQLDEAVTHLTTAIQLRPEFPLAHFNLGCVLADQGQGDKAITHLSEALRQKPDYDEARQALRKLQEQSK